MSLKYRRHLRNRGFHSPVRAVEPRCKTCKCGATALRRLWHRQGLKIIRYTNNEVRTNLTGVLEDILRKCEELKKGSC